MSFWDVIFSPGTLRRRRPRVVAVLGPDARAMFGADPDSLTADDLAGVPDVTGMTAAAAHREVIKVSRSRGPRGRLRASLDGRGDTLIRHAPEAVTPPTRNARCGYCNTRMHDALCESGQADWPCPDYTDAARGLPVLGMSLGAPFRG